MEGSRLSPRYVPPGHVAAPDPTGGMLVLPRGRSGRTWEVSDPYGGSEASAVSFGASLPQGRVASPDPSSSGERVRGRWPGEVRA